MTKNAFALLQALSYIWVKLVDKGRKGDRKKKIKKNGKKSKMR